MGRVKIKEEPERSRPVFPAVVRIDSLAAGGMAVGRLEGMVVFIPGGAPGDLVEVEEVKQSPDYAIGKIVRIIEPSPLRRRPPCPYFLECGGCQWQHISYKAQLEAKERILAEAFRLQGEKDPLSPDPITPSLNEFQYRHRVQLKILTSRGKMRWGFFAATSHQLVDVRECLIAHQAVNSMISELDRFISFLQVNPSQLGGVDINVDATGRRIEFILHSRRRRFNIPGHGRRIDYRTEDGQPLNVQVINASKIKKLPVKEGDFTFEAEGLTLSTGAGVFSQANLAMNPPLVKQVVELVQATHEDTIVDIYSGAGNYSIPLAGMCARVEAVENNPRACRFGQLNASKYGFKNIRFHQKSAREALGQLPRVIKAVILNPPRVGAGEIIHQLAELDAARIVYVSCNPATLSRDLSVLSGAGYRLARLIPFDMFPQTHHLEVVALALKE
jgi:23S rRNA (uracil1939-C5)-methyltransferase